MNNDRLRTNPDDGEQRETYFQTLLLAEKLGDQLSQHIEPVAREMFLAINNPLVMEKVMPPIELSIGDHVTEQVRIEFSESLIDGCPEVNSNVILEFEDGGECRIPVPEGDSEDIVYTFVPQTEQGVNRYTMPIANGTISRTEVSAIISRVVEPNTDPRLTNFRRLDSVAARQEVIDILKNTDYVQVIEVSVYEVDGHEITVSSEAIADSQYTKSNEESKRQSFGPHGRITEISITLPRIDPNDKSDMIALRTTLDNNSHSQEIFAYEGDERRTIPPYPEEINAFRDTLEALLDHIGQPAHEESYEDLASKSLTRSARKTIEERE